MSTLSLSGLASGLDTESIISQLMSVEQAPKTRMQQQGLDGTPLGGMIYVFPEMIAVIEDEARRGAKEAERGVPLVLAS